MHLKDVTKKLLQSVLGFQTYLYYFSLFKINTLHRDPDEQTIFRFIERVPEGSLVLDVGANLGFVTYHLAQIRGCSVLAFEPIPTNLTVLTRIVAKQHLRNVTILPYALGHENATVRMVMPIENGIPRQGFSHIKTNDTLEPGYEFTVPVKRLDDLAELTNRAERVGGLKIDAEDYEYFILLGGLKLIKQHRPVICIELWENANRVCALALLATLGYTSYRLYRGGLLEWAEQPFDFADNNFICLPGESASA